jgi:tRNA pseudouridine38-40 synthase
MTRISPERAGRWTEMRNYKMILAYDGTEFCGWQRQPAVRTVQGELEAVLSRITQKKVAVMGAGRTDAGVHARAQAAHFRSDTVLPREELLRAANSLLPRDIRILALTRASDSFHALRSARSKVYEYRIWNSPRISPFLIRYVLYWPHELNISRMEEAARLFEREADFSAFSSNRLLHPVRKILRSRIRKRGAQIIYAVEANGFLRYMVRTIVGTLIEVGRGKMPPSQIEEIFRKNDRSLAGNTAPPEGLSLVRVKY